MPLFANRVSASATSSTWTSVSAAPVDFANRKTASITPRSSRGGSSSARPDFPVELCFELGDIFYCFEKAVPIRTFRNRDGAAPCPVPMVCIGCPLPQFGVPQSVQWSNLQIASQEFQNSVVIPL